MVGSTEVLSYALLLFLGFVYLPYALFTLVAECFIDLGRRRDSTQLEEIISAFLPAFLFHGIAIVVFICVKKPNWPLDWAAVAAIFGKDRGAISDYIYGGDLVVPGTYVVILWLVAVLLGMWFGWSAKLLCSQNAALDGVERISLANFPQYPFADLKQSRIASSPSSWNLTVVTSTAWQWFIRHKYFVFFGWYPWKWFFHESFVPLFTWRAQEPTPGVCIQTRDQGRYWATFMGYEKTTDGRMEAVHLNDVFCCLQGSGSLESWEIIDHMYLKWTRVTEMHYIKHAKYKMIVEGLKAKVGP